MKAQRFFHKRKIIRKKKNKDRLIICYLIHTKKNSKNLVLVFFSFNI